MDDLIDSFDSISIKEEYNQTGYLSEIFSPSRLWIQLDNDSKIFELNRDINIYYETNKYLKSLNIDETSFYVGMKIGSFICGKWHRATVLSNLTVRGNICIFVEDYGTKGYVNIKNCRILPIEFLQLPRQTIKACLHGISTPRNTRLFDIEATDAIIKFCYNRVFRFKFVKYHPTEDFYEIIARRDDGELLNNFLINAGHAKPICDNTKYSVFYPSFDLLEASPFYETYTHRYLYKKRGVDFNAFEEECMNPNPNHPYEEQLLSLFQNDKYAAVRKVFEALRS